MSLSSLYDVSKSAVELSEQTVEAAEEALAAAKAANTQAKTALEAIKAAMENEARQKEMKVQESKNQSRNKETVVEELYKTPDNGSHPSSAPNNKQSLSGPRNVCCVCKKLNCLRGEPLTVDIVEDPTGVRVRAAGQSWAEAYTDLEGIVTGSKQTRVNKFLKIRWDVSSKDDQYTFLSKNEPKFVIAQCTQAHDHIRTVKDPEPKKPQPNQKCLNCKSVVCKSGKICSNPTVGMRLQATEAPTVEKKYHRQRGTVIEIAEDKMHIIYDMDIIKGKENQTFRKYKIVCKSEPRFVIDCDHPVSPEHQKIITQLIHDRNPKVEEEPISRTVDGKCINCKATLCLHGQFLNDPSENYVGTLVQYFGRNCFGVVKEQSKNGRSLLVQNPNQDAPKYFGLKKGGEYFFKYHCTKRKEDVMPSNEPTQDDISPYSESDTDSEGSFVELSSPTAQIVDLEEEREKVTITQVNNDKSYDEETDEAKLFMQAKHEEELAHIAFDNGDYEQAIKHHENAIKYFPHGSHFFYNFGLVCCKLQRYDEGVKNLKKAIELGEKNGEGSKLMSLAWNFLARCYWKLNDFEAGRDAYVNAHSYKFNTGLLSSAEDPEEVQSKIKERADTDIAKYEAMAEKEKGNVAFKALMFEIALKHYERSVSLDPTDIVYFNNLAAALLQIGNYEKCLATCKKAIEVGKENNADCSHVAKAFNRQGKCLKTMGRLESAMSAFEQAVQENSTMEFKRNLLDVSIELLNKHLEDGNNAFFSERWNDAVKHFTEALNISPKNYFILTNRAAALCKLKKHDEAINDCDRAIQLLPTLDCCSAFEAKNPWYFSPFGWKAKNLLLSGRTNEAKTVFQQIRRSNPELQWDDMKEEFINKSIPRDFLETHCPSRMEMEKEKLADDEKKQGDTCFAAGNFEDAIKHLTKSIELNPSDPKVFCNRAASHFKLKRFRATLDDCKRALAIDQNHVNSYLRMAAALKSLGNFKKHSTNPYENPLACYLRVLDIDENHVVAGNAFMKMFLEFFEDGDDSVDKMFTQQLAELVKFFPIYSGACKLAKGGKLNEALNEVKRVLAINQNYFPAHLLKASLLRQTGRVHQAMDIYKTLLVSKPNDKDASDGVEECKKILATENAKSVL